MCQHQHEDPPQLEPSVERIQMELRDVPPELLHEGETGVEEAQADDEPQRDDRELRIAADPGIDVDVRSHGGVHCGFASPC